jgi:hypothetical protein
MPSCSPTALTSCLPPSLAFPTLRYAAAAEQVRRLLAA